MNIFDGMFQSRHLRPVYRGMGMKVQSFFARSLALIIFATMFASYLCPSLSDDSEPLRKTRVLATGDPVAIISPLPDEVSNGTWWNLNASGSSDPDGLITNVTWSITIADTVTHLFGLREDFKFKTLGLYKIVLTVEDNDNKTASAFTAVYSIIDSDRDGLPDWWEMKYLLSLRESGSDDRDRDGYTNIQEYASHTDPTVKNPQPGLVTFLKDNWLYLAIIAGAIVAVIFAIMPSMKRKRERNEKAKIEYAIEIEKALQGEK